MSELYDVYHIKYATLLRMMNRKEIAIPPHLKEKHCSIVSAFRQLIDKRSIRSALRDGNPRLLRESWSKIGDAAQELLESSWYSHVAQVNCNDAIEAIRATTSINVLWFLAPKKNVVVEEVATRSTAHLDIIAVKGKFYLYVLGGFYSLKDSEFVGVMNEPK